MGDDEQAEMRRLGRRRDQADDEDEEGEDLFNDDMIK